MAVYLDAFFQCFFLPKPAFTESQLPSQSGRVFIVTGGYAGVGKELTKILYGKNGTVYIAGRSKDKYDAAVKEIKGGVTSSEGRLEFLKLDLADLEGIRGSAEEFLRREERLDVLTNNAGVMTPPVGSKTTQGYELQAGTNVLGPYLFTTYLTPLMQKTAAKAEAGSVRVTWAASLATMGSPSGGIAIDPKTNGPKVYGNRISDYAQSKACNVLLAHEFQKRFGKDGIVSNAWNPGNLASELQRHQGRLEGGFTKLLVYPPILGGYTELFAGWSPEPGQPENKDKYIGPWGRFVTLRPDIEKNRDKGGEDLWKWCEQETAKYR